MLKTEKRFSSVIIMALVLMISLLAVRSRALADVIYEPEDDFYNKNSAECEYCGRAFIANGPNSIVKAYKSPESAKIVDEVNNGRRIWISFIYTDKDNIRWGLGEYTEGWMPMDYLVPAYDGESFMEEYWDSISQTDFDLDESYSEKEIFFWQYPGSEIRFKQFIEAEYQPSITMSYTDEEGRQWGYTHYYYGVRDSWICLDVPEADIDELYPDGAPDHSPEIIPIDTDNSKEIVPHSGVPVAMIVVVISMVAAVVAVSAVLLTLLKKKGKH